MAVVLHGLKVFNFAPFYDKKWENKKISEFMEKERQSKNTWE